MKSSAAALLLLTGMLFACDEDVQPDKVPVAVRQALLDTFPTSSYIEWEKNGKDYEADFTQDAHEYAALFNPTGNLLQHKHTIPAADLPDAVTASIQRRFTGYTLDELEKVLKNGGTYYQVEVETSTKEERLVLSPDGQPAPLPYWD